MSLRKNTTAPAITRPTPKTRASLASPNMVELRRENGDWTMTIILPWARVSARVAQLQAKKALGEISDTLEPPDSLSSGRPARSEVPQKTALGNVLASFL